MNTSKRPSRLSDVDVVKLFLLIDPDITHLELHDQFPDSKFVFLTSAGVITGVLVGHDDHSFDVRDDSGQITKVLKRSVSAVRRPPIVETETSDSEIIENASKPGGV